MTSEDTGQSRNLYLRERVPLLAPSLVLHAGLEQASSVLQGHHELRGQAQERAAEARPARRLPWGDNTDQAALPGAHLPGPQTTRRREQTRQCQTAAGVTKPKRIG